jgi:hypothetical protein
MENIRSEYLKIKICASGAAETDHCGEGALDKAKEIGKQVAEHGAVLVSGATTGFPLWVARGAKEAGGISIGISPAATEKEHVEIYHLPLDFQDLIIYSGSGYSGRNLLLTRSSDAVIVGCGRIGTLNEFTIAYEDDKPIGILEGEWGTDELIKKILDESHRGYGKVIFDPDPKKLVERLIEMVQKEKDVIRKPL